MQKNDKFYSGDYVAELNKENTYSVFNWTNNNSVGWIKNQKFTSSLDIELTIKNLHDILNIVYMIKDNTPPAMP